MVLIPFPIRQPRRTCIGRLVQLQLQHRGAATPTNPHCCFVPYHSLLHPRSAPSNASPAFALKPDKTRRNKTMQDGKTNIETNTPYQLWNGGARVLHLDYVPLRGREHDLKSIDHHTGPPKLSNRAHGLRVTSAMVPGPGPRRPVWPFPSELRSSPLPSFLPWQPRCPT